MARIPGERPRRQATNGEARNAESFLRPRVRCKEQHRCTDEQTDVASTSCEKCFEGCATIGAVLPPVTNQQERAHSHDFPAQNKLNHVLCKNHVEHSCGKQSQCPKEMGVPNIATKVLDRINLDQC